VPARYASESFDSLDLPISQDLRAFQVSSQVGVKPSHLTPFELDQTIQHLEKAGSNVEILRTAWHGKFAYACSIIVMGVLALIVSRLTKNIYKATALSVLIVFFYYTTNTICMSMGEKALLSPFAGAWFANVFFFLGGLLWLSGPGILRKLRGVP
jgi:lipopolysaccharide export system permease protein